MYNPDNIKRKRLTPKRASYACWYNQLMTFALGIFNYRNLPANLPAQEIEQRLIIDGYSAIFRTKLYGIVTASGGKSGVNIYNESSQFNFSQPILGSKSGLKDMIDGVIMYGATIDRYLGYGSTGAYIRYYADVLSDIDITRRVMMINGRAVNTVTAKTDNALRALTDFYCKIEEGAVSVPLLASGILPSTDDLLKGVKTNTFSLSDLDYAQHNALKLFYAHFGVAYSSDKAERLIEDEVNADKDALNVNIANMLSERQKGVNAINRLYGTNITVSCNNISVT